MKLKNKMSARTILNPPLNTTLNNLSTPIVGHVPSSQTIASGEAYSFPPIALPSVGSASSIVFIQVDVVGPGTACTPYAISLPSPYTILTFNIANEGNDTATLSGVSYLIYG